MSADDNRWPRIREVMRRARRKYEVNGRRGTGGKIGKREYFDTKEDAKKRADELRAEVKKKGVESLSLTTPQRVMAEECIKRLAVRGRSLKDATDFYLKHLEVTAKSIKWRDFVEQLWAEKESDGSGHRHVKDLRYRLRQFNAAVGDRIVAEITTADIDKFLRELKVTERGHKNFDKPVSVTSRNNSRRLLNVAFNAAVAHGYCSSNPAKAAVIAQEARPEDDSDEDEAHEVTLADILTPVEAKALLQAAEPPLVPYLALNMFAGIRSSELMRLFYRRVDWKKGEIYVPSTIAKKKTGRFIPMCPALKAWLAPYREASGRVAPRGFRDMMDRAKAAAEVALAKAGHPLATWPNNYGRHSFASYFYAKTGDAKELALQMGHRDVDLIFRVYRTPAPRALATKFWAIRP